MTYSILVTYNNNAKEGMDIPFSNSKSFPKYFTPKLANHNFGILPLLPTGYFLPLEDLNQFILELETIIKDFSNEDRIENEIIERINFVITRLNGLDIKIVTEIYLG